MKAGSSWNLLWVLCALLLGLPRFCSAHTTGLSTSELKFGTNGWEAQFTFATADLLAAWAHVETSSPLDANRDGKLTQEELAGGVERLRTFAAGALVVEADGQRLVASVPRLAMDDKENFHMEMSFPGQRPGRLRVRAVLFEHLPADHTHFVAVHESDGSSLGNKLLGADDDTLEITVPNGTENPERRVSTFTGFLKLGVEHIWTGYDHLLFLLALLLACNTFKSAIQVVTVFTLAHSLTLVFATLDLVSVSGQLVEPAIAASIIYVGVENLVRPEGPKGRWLITFLFGLIHGFGFATVLRDLGVATGTGGVAVPLVAFNLGVEAGQIVIAAILLPVIWKLRKWEFFRRYGRSGCSVIIAAAGGYWLIQRLFF